MAKFIKFDYVKLKNEDKDICGYIMDILPDYNTIKENNYYVVMWNTGEYGLHKENDLEYWAKFDLNKDFGNKNTLQQAISHYGNQAQMQMAIEEMAELTKEICKRFRGADNWEQIAEEVADVEITLEQLKIIGGIGSDVEQLKARKLKSLAEMIEKNEG